ncbi:T9SS type B sorting domain-containing protein [Flavobacterium sp. 3-210]
MTATGLVAGNYTLEVTDAATGCKATASMTVSEPDALALAIDKNKNANCNSDAKVSVIATGGTAPYQYSFVPATAPGPGTYSTSNEALLNPTTTTSWKVYVKDANNCVIGTPLAIPIGSDDAPTITAPALICFVGTSTNVTVGYTSDTDLATAPMFSVNGGGFQASPTFAISAPGTYTFVIKDENGCTASASYEVKPQVTLQADLVQDLTCDVNGSITLTPNGGTGTYTYEVDIDGAGYNPATTPYTATVDGSYTFRVTDSQGCPAVSNVVVVTPKTVPQAAATALAVKCAGDSNGSVTVTASNGIAPYQYRIDGGVFQASNVFNGLGAGPHNVEVKDAKGCISAAVPVTVVTPVALTASSSITTALVCTAGNAPSKAVVTVTAAGGTGSYEYSYDNGANYSNNATYETYAGATFDIIVKDANGCSVTITNGVDVPALNPPTDLTIATTVAVICGGKGTVDITSHVGGVLPLEYEILSPITRAKQPGTTFANLDPGTYVFQVTDKNGCTYTESYTVDPVINITVAGELVKNVSCNSGSDGVIKFTVGNKAGGYTASLNSPLGTLTQVGDVVTVTNLPAGSYTLTVIDAITTCTNTATVVVDAPAVLGLNIVSQTAANCYLGAVVTVQGTGGTPAYKYAFVHAGDTPLATDFSSTNYAVLDPAFVNWDVYVMDANLICSAVRNVTIIKHDAPTINPNANVYCYTGGPVPITITGTTDSRITAPTMYSIGNGYKSSPDFTLNAPGTYDFYIKDGNGCIAHATYVLRQELLIQATLTQDLNCTSNDATIALSATQGTGAGTYAFEYDLNNSGVYKPVTALPFVTSTPGTYTFRVQDASTCQAVSVPVIVTPLTIPAFTTATVDVLCQGDSNGSITVTGLNGVAPYKYSIDGGTTFVNSNIFAGLGKGTYSIAVMDAKGCPSLAVNVDINEPVVLTATNVVTPFGCDASNNAKDAIVTITANGGTTPYSYSFDNGASFGSSPVHTVNTASTINYVVVDANGCRTTGSAIVPVYNPPTNFDINATPIYCNTAGGVATITVSNIVGGDGPFNYAIVEPAASATSNNTGSFANLLPATYLIKVTDNNGCSTLNSIEIKKASEISVDAQLLSDVLCNGGTTGSIAFTVSNYISPANYTFALSPNNGTYTQTGDVITYTGLTAANYTFTVTDNTSGCTDNVTNFLVNQPTAPLSFTMTATDINCNNKNATITVTATGGTPAYSYAAVQGGTAAPTSYSSDNKIVVNTNNGTVLAWDVYVKDFNGCTTLVQTQNISTAPLPNAITANITSQCPTTGGTYEFTVSASGVAPLQYSIGNGFQTDPKFTVTAPGSYDIIVRDGNGCEVTVTGAVVIEDALDLRLDIQKLPDCDTSVGTVVATTTGGSGNYKYTSGAYIPFVVGNTATFTMPVGTHTIIVTDLTYGCTDRLTVDLTAATEITGLVLKGTNVSCIGGSNGSIKVILEPSRSGVNDNPIYTYQLTGTTINNTPVNTLPQTQNVFDNLEPGDYTVIVSSGRGCHAQEDIRITQPAKIVVDAPVVTQFACTSGTNTTQNASITVNSVTGGSGNYIIYEFKDANGVVVQSGTSNVYNVTNTAGGNYSVRVLDDMGCEGSSTAPIVISSFITMTDVTAAPTIPITCLNSETMQVTVTTVGGTPVLLNYTLTSVTGAPYNRTNTSGLFTDLGIGHYNITVVNPATGCIIKDYYEVLDPNTFVIDAKAINGKICYGTADGVVDLTFIDNQVDPRDDAGRFTYTISGPVSSSGTTTNAGPIRISNLTAGQYTVVATLIDSPSCTVSTVFTIEQPTELLTLVEDHTEITCLSGNNDGTITVTAKGGWIGDYQYELVGPVSVNYSDQFTFENLTAGHYIINVKDSRGCIATAIVDLVNPTPISFTASSDVNVVTCFGGKTATITATIPTGGQGSNYSYTLNYNVNGEIASVGPQISNVFSGLGSGTYTVVVTDGFSCEATSAPITITDPAIVEATLVLDKSITCLTDARLTLSATGGTGPYTYSADGINYSTSFNSSVTFPVSVGLHHYYVKDSFGCVGYISNDINIDPVTPLTIDLDTSSAVVNCKGDSSALIIAEAKGGLGNYEYSLLNELKVEIRPAQAEGIFADVAAGKYIIHVKSGDCQTDSEVINVGEPANALVSSYQAFPVKCFGDKNGKIVITASGGTGTIKYAISPNLAQFVENNVFDRLEAGKYQVIVQDIKGCTAVYDIEIGSPTILIASEIPNTMIPEVCEGDKDGAFSIQVKGGTAPYFESLDKDNGPFLPMTGSTKDYSNLSGGIHNVYIQDSNGCISVVEIDMPLPVILKPTVEINYDCVNNMSANMVTVDPGFDKKSEIDYQLDGTGTYQVSNIFTNLAPGNHFINARHTNGCVVPTKSFQIKAVQPLKLALSAGKPEMNIISVTATGGAPGYEYSFNGEPFTSSNTYKIYKSGDYVVVVRDQNGCTSTITVPAIYVDVCLDNYFTPNGDGVYDTWGPGCTNIYNNLEFSIFDRYGRVIAKYHYGQKWDGRYNGEELPSGDYWYVLKLNDEKDAREFVGHFTLYR